MKKLCIVTCLSALLSIVACNHDKPKPVSKNITKTAVVVNNRKDSVINNPQHNYRTATISEPCTQIMLKNIQCTAEFRTITTGKPAADITYQLNWVKADEPMIRSNGAKITNGIETGVYLKGRSGKKKIASFLFNNEDAKLYYLKPDSKYDELEEVNATELKRIRNACYWGVASHQ